MSAEAGHGKTGWLRQNLANMLTLTRLCLLPLIVWTYGLYAPDPAWPTAVIVLIAALSDAADGLAARRLHATSRFGRWVDPLVDRVFFFTVVATLWYHGTLPWVAVLPLLVRDALLLILAVPLLRRTGEDPTPSRLGKAANPILVCALEGFIVGLRTVAWVFYAVGATLYVVTALRYGYHALAAVRAARGGRIGSRDPSDPGADRQEGIEEGTVTPQVEPTYGLSRRRQSRDNEEHGTAQEETAKPKATQSGAA